MIEEHRFFWRQHPALLFSLTLLIGAGASLFWATPWNWIFPLLWCSYLILLKKWPLLLILASSIAYCHFLHPQSPPSGKSAGIFSIATLQPHQSPFSKGFVYKGTLATKVGSVPCDIYTHGQTPPKPADCDYFLEGRLHQRGPFNYLFKPKEWAAIPKSWSLAEWRYLAKEAYRGFLAKKCRGYPRAAQFLAALTTGDVDDRVLKYEFGRLGLQHLLAISGFHFGILIAFASFVLSLLLPRFWKLLLLLFSLTAYYLFVGPFPAVQRSWLTAFVYVAGKLIHRQTSGLNLLGLALGVEICLNPLIVSNLGFQFSFASCGGILLFHPFFEKKLRAILPKRSKAEMAALPFFIKHVYLLTGLLRQTIALDLAVNAALLPLLLYHFHVFPLLSLLYNLFFPLLLGAALCILLLALTFQLLIPTLADLLFTATSWFTEQLLDMAAYPPAALDYPILVANLPAWAIPFFLFGLLAISMRLTSKTREGAAGY